MRLYTVEDIAFYQQIRHLFAAERPYKITRLYDRIDIHIQDSEVATFNAYDRTSVLVAPMGSLY